MNLRFAAVAAALLVPSAWAEDLTVSGMYPATLGLYPNLTVTESASLARGAGEGVAIGLEAPEPAASLHLRSAIPRLRLESAAAASLGAFDLRVFDTAAFLKALAFHDVEAGVDRLVIDSRGYLGVGMEPTKPLSSASGISVVGQNRSEIELIPNPPSTIVNKWFMGVRNDEFVWRAEGTLNQGWVLTADGRLYLGGGVTANGQSPRANRKIDTGTNAYLRDSPPGWVNASSRQFKTGVRPLDAARANDTLAGLRPVSFNYKHSGLRSLGFIAEEVPELLADPDKMGLGPLEIIAVLTKAAQEQQREIEQLERLLEEAKR